MIRRTASSPFKTWMASELYASSRDRALVMVIRV